MGQIKKMMELSFFILLFCVAISNLFLGNKSITRLQRKIYQTIDNEIAIELYKEQQKLLITKADIMAYLMASKLDYDIEINGLLIRKISHNPLTIHDNMIVNGNYTKNYFYDMYGKVTKVIYQKVE